VAAPVVCAPEGDAVVGRGVFLLRAVVFGTCPVQGRRPIFAIYEDHVVTFSVPVPQVGPAEVVDVQHAADVVAVALGSVLALRPSTS